MFLSKNQRRKWERYGTVPKIDESWVTGALFRAEVAEARKKIYRKPTGVVKMRAWEGRIPVPEIE